jgi:translation initiation factor eIF-2B subunit beta
VTLISDAAAFAVLPRVTKVLLPAAAIALSGEVVAPAGSAAIAASAAAAGVPVLVVCSGLKVLPVATAAALPGVARAADPASVLPFPVAASLGLEGPGAVLSPAWDVLEPSLVTLVITSAGCCGPAQVWRLAEDAFGEAPGA